MNLSYTVCFENQEEPELSPNEMAYNLAELTGLDHYLCHRALALVNPELGQLDDTTLHLPVRYLPELSLALNTLLISEPHQVKPTTGHFDDFSA